MSLLSLIGSIASAIKVVFQWLSEGRLIELGERRAADAAEDVQRRANEKAEAIDRRDAPSVPDLLAGLRGPKTTDKP